jgi:hypothetical protein
MTIKATEKTKMDRGRSTMLNMRIDPKLKYLAEIASREQRRSLSSFIELAIRRALTIEAMTDAEPKVASDPLKKQQQQPMWGEGFWDVDEADRAFKLATRPDLLTFAEQQFFKLFMTHMELSGKPASLKSFREFYKAVYVDGKQPEGEE